MANKGFIPSAATFIRQIRQNLSEGRYTLGESGFSIVKELVQNSDDAGAKTMVIGLSDPLKDSKHPLLRSPGLFVINDGRFERHDGDNIRRFGENTKAIDAAKIGKFGLGLKSIFHLCEAFFFLASAGGNHVSVADVLNPWSSDGGDHFHEEWDFFDDHEQQLVVRQLSPLLKGTRWFCLWIPLRQREQLRGNEPIYHSFPGDEGLHALSDGRLPSQLATLLPLLSNLESVKGLKIGRAGLEALFDVSIREKSQRRKRFEELPPQVPARIGGSVEIAIGNDRVQELIYVGDELKLSDSALITFVNDEHWPSDLGRDPDTDRWKNIKEKARQHAGVCLSLIRTGQRRSGRLTISWAVFLPLGEAEPQLLDVADIDVTLLLHGYFFVDAGRNRPTGLTDSGRSQTSISSDEQLRRAWNRRLAEVGTVPLVLGSLERLLQDGKVAVNYGEMRAITRAIQVSHFYSMYRSEICSSNSWAALYGSAGQRQWRLFPAGESVVELPAPGSDKLPWLVFPALEELVADLNVATVSEPRLAREGTEATWPTKSVERLVDSVPPGDTFRHPERLDYFIAFLDQLSQPGFTRTHDVKLARVARLGLRDCGLASARDRSEQLRRFFYRVPADRRIPISLGSDGIAEQLFAELCDHQIDVVFIPGELDSDEQPGNGVLRIQDAIAILNGLAKRQAAATTTSDREAISLLAAQLLWRTMDEDAVKRACGDLSLFVAKDCRKRTNSDIAVSWKALNTWHLNKVLFVLPPSYAYQLQDALRDEHVLLVSKALFEFLFPNEEPPSCRQNQLLETLRRTETPTLQAPSHRLALLKTLLDYQAGRKEPQFSECVRYLLHGAPTQFSSSATLLVSHHGQSEVWRRITLLALNSRNAQWRIVDADFARRLDDDEREEFQIHEIGAESAKELIREAGPIAFADLRPSAQEYSLLLREIEDNQLCREMPIHEDVAGNFAPIGARC